MKKDKSKRLNRAVKSPLVGVHLDPLGEIHVPDHNFAATGRCGHIFAIGFYEPEEVQYIVEHYILEGLCPDCYMKAHGHGTVTWMCWEVSNSEGDTITAYYPDPDASCPHCKAGTAHEH